MDMPKETSGSPISELRWKASPRAAGANACFAPLHYNVPLML